MVDYNEEEDEDFFEEVGFSKEQTGQQGQGRQGQGQGQGQSGGEGQGEQGEQGDEGEGEGESEGDGEPQGEGQGQGEQGEEKEWQGEEGEGEGEGEGEEEEGDGEEEGEEGEDEGEDGEDDSEELVEFRVLNFIYSFQNALEKPVLISDYKDVLNMAYYTDLKYCISFDTCKLIDSFINKVYRGTAFYILRNGKFYINSSPENIEEISNADGKILEVIILDLNKLGNSSILKVKQSLSQDKIFRCFTNTLSQLGLKEKANEKELILEIDQGIGKGMVVYLQLIKNTYRGYYYNFFINDKNMGLMEIFLLNDRTMFNNSFKIDFFAFLEKFYYSEGMYFILKNGDERFDSKKSSFFTYIWNFVNVLKETTEKK